MRFDPVRFGALFRGLISAQVGGFLSVDVLRLLLDSEHDVALFIGADVFARWSSSWTPVLLGVVGGRSSCRRCGADFVELISALSAN